MKQILLIAERSECGSLYTSFLEGAGCAVTNISKLAKNEYKDMFGKPFDLVILTTNGQLPGDILDQAFFLRDNHPDRKILVLTGWSDQEFLARLKEMAAEVQSLPVQRDAFIKLVRSFVPEQEG